MLENRSIQISTVTVILSKVESTVYRVWTQAFFTAWNIYEARQTIPGLRHEQNPLL